MAGIAAALGYWSMVAGMNMSSDPAEVRARTSALLPEFSPPEPLVAFFARRMERSEGADEGVVWAVDSRYQNLLLVVRSASAEPASDAALIEALTTVHPSLAGFDPEATEPPRKLRLLELERPVLVQSARTVDEGRQLRSCVAFPYAGRWVYLMLQGDAVDAGPDALERLLAPLKPSPPRF